MVGLAFQKNFSQANKLQNLDKIGECYRLVGRENEMNEDD